MCGTKETRLELPFGECGVANWVMTERFPDQRLLGWTFRNGDQGWVPSGTPRPGGTVNDLRCHSCGSRPKSGSDLWEILVTANFVKVEVRRAGTERAEADEGWVR